MTAFRRFWVQQRQTTFSLWIFARVNAIYIIRTVLEVDWPSGGLGRCPKNLPGGSGPLDSRDPCRDGRKGKVFPFYNKRVIRVATSRTARAQKPRPAYCSLTSLPLHIIVYDVYMKIKNRSGGNTLAACQSKCNACWQVPFAKVNAMPK